MTEVTIIVGNYVFWNFNLSKDGTTVNFCIGLPSSGDIGDDGIQSIKTILNDLGKWESLVKTGLNLLSDLGIRQIETAVIRSYDKPFGIELYEHEIKRGDSNRFDCSLHIRKEERHRRRDRRIDPVFSVKEITDQLMNIPKWKALAKTISTVKEPLAQYKSK